MRSELEKMLAGEPYSPADPELTAMRKRARGLCRKLDGCLEQDENISREALVELFAAGGDSACVQPPFFCDYGLHISLGENVYFNYNCVVLDVCPVKIGSNTLFGPAVQIYTATHPLQFAERRELEYGKPVTIGDDVWIGGGSVLCPGVTIGSRTIIGAGSVVTRAIPPDVVAAGNPCRVIRNNPE